MSDSDGITIEDVKDWENSDVTRVFYEWIQDLIQRENERVHRSLRSDQPDQNRFYQAALANAAIDVCEEILDFTKIYVEELKEEK